MTPKEQKILQQAQHLLSQNEVSSAKNVLLNYCKQNKPNDHTKYLLSMCHTILLEHDKALAIIKPLVKRNPKNIECLKLLGTIHHNMNDYDAAIQTFKRALTLNNNDILALSNLASALLQTNDYEEAEIFYKKSLGIEPKQPGVLTNFGLLKQTVKKFDEAIELHQKALQYAPNNMTACYNLAFALHENGELEKSLQAYNKFITATPNHIPALCDISHLLGKLNQPKQAIETLLKATQLNLDKSHSSELSKAYNNLGNAILEHDNNRQYYKEIINIYLKAIEIYPDNNDSYKNLAICYQNDGDFDNAFHYYFLYTDRSPNDESAIANIAIMYELIGEFDKGMEILKPFMNKDDINPIIVFSYVKLARHFNKLDDAISALLNINDEIANEETYKGKYYSLGKLSEKKGDANITFDYYKKANDAQTIDSYSFENDKNTFNHTAQYFTKERIRTINRAECSSNLPIFIVGMPRSGTSLAEQILASHPDIHGAGELEKIHQIINKISSDLKCNNSYVDNLESMTTDYATKLSNDHVIELQKMAPDAKYIVDKMPHNFMGLGLINLLFPKATVIHCKRSSIDTCFSIYCQSFNTKHMYSTNLSLLGKYYNLYADLMNHWKSVLDLNIIDLQYENVVANPEKEIKDLLNKCNIEWDEKCLNFHNNNRLVMTPSYNQVRKPMYNSSVAKWKKYEHLIGDLIESLGERAY